MFVIFDMQDICSLFVDFAFVCDLRDYSRFGIKVCVLRGSLQSIARQLANICNDFR